MYKKTLTIPIIILFVFIIILSLKQESFGNRAPPNPLPNPPSSQFPYQVCIYGDQSAVDNKVKISIPGGGGTQLLTTTPTYYNVFPTFLIFWIGEGDWPPDNICKGDDACKNYYQVYDPDGASDYLKNFNSIFVTYNDGIGTYECRNDIDIGKYSNCPPSTFPMKCT